MVDVAHDGDHRGTRLALDFRFFAANFLDQSLFRTFRFHRLRVVAHLLDQNGCGFLVDALIDGGHDAELHHALEQIAALHGHALRQIRHGNDFGDFHIAHHGRSGALEAVFGTHTDRSGGSAARLAVLAAALLALGDVQFLALAALLFALFVRFRPAVAFRCPAQVLLRTRARHIQLAGAFGTLLFHGLFRRALAIRLRGFGLFLSTCLRLGGLALRLFLLALDFRGFSLAFFLGLAFGLFTRLLLRLSRLGGFALRLLLDLLAPIDIGASLAHLDIHGTPGRTAAPGVDLELRLRASTQGNTAAPRAQSAATALAAAGIEMTQQTYLVVIAEQVIRPTGIQAGLG